LDIEGTTTPISFVADVLFPYIRRRLKMFLEDNWEKQDFKYDVSLIKEQALQDEKNGVEYIPIANDSDGKEKILESIEKNLILQMNKDRKTTALKNLQGHMWKEGYQCGELKGEVYSDVVEALEFWKNQKMPVYIYSSGSIEAQKLIFGHSIHGNLLKYIEGHFDLSTIGSKVESNSYEIIFEKISKEMESKGKKNVRIEQLLFVTDNILEAQAAVKKNLHVVLADRPGNKPLPEGHCFDVIKSFKYLIS